MVPVRTVLIQEEVEDGELETLTCESIAELMMM